MGQATRQVELYVRNWDNRFIKTSSEDEFYPSFQTGRGSTLIMSPLQLRIDNLEKFSPFPFTLAKELRVTKNKNLVISTVLIRANRFERLIE